MPGAELCWTDGRQRARERSPVPHPQVSLARSALTPLPPVTHSPAGCDFYTNCAACVADTTCGWCAAPHDLPAPTLSLRTHTCTARSPASSSRAVYTLPLRCSETHPSSREQPL